MVGVKKFAEGYERDEDRPNLILFPRDVELRKSLYPEEVFSHPAKMQMHLVKACVDYYAEPEWKILDPFGGTGTTAYASTLGPYHVTLIELEQAFVDILIKTRKMWREGGDCEYLPTVLAGDCRQIMPQLPAESFNMVLTSPPYANLLAVGKVKEQGDFSSNFVKDSENMSYYSGEKASILNLGRVNAFVFGQQMAKVYQGIYRVLKPGGVFISVTKDTIRANKRYMFSSEVIRGAQAQGLVYSGDWFKWKAPGALLQKLQRSKGMKVVEDEDIVVFRKAGLE